MQASLEINLFGTCSVRLSGDDPLDVRGAKHRALICMLATAPLGRRTRTYLQNTLWGYSGYDCGHQNLRRALADLRKQFGRDFDFFFHTTNSDVELDLEHVRFVGDVNAGLFLEDLNVKQRDFEDWVASIRANPAQIAALHRSPAASAVRRPRPRVVVLPLNYLGDDPVLRALGDWIGEQTCRILSRSKLLSVISHLSGRAMVQNPIVISDVRQTLDVDYLANGTIRRSGKGVVCDIDFIAAATGQVLWTRELYLEDANHLDKLNESLNAIAFSIARSIAHSAVAAVQAQQMDDIEDHNLTIAGATLMHRRTLRDFLKSRDYLIEAQTRMDGIAEPLTWLGKWYVLNVMKGYSLDRARDAQMAVECCARALDIDPESSLALTIDGFVHTILDHNVETAERRFDTALQINPNESLAWLLKGSLKAFTDDGAAAVDATTRARRLSPIDPFGYYYDSLASTAHLAAENYQNALDYADKSLRTNDRHLSTHRARIVALHHLGRGEDARKAAQMLMKNFPTFSLAQYRKSHPATNYKLGQQAIAALSASGID
ncbi:hypothetical protein MWU54_04720 [Marivita sp. S6314]|uniref:hypothetical protein n=1 Tax=Marivita sp. S6314 TaxID=2926406 RepID=UPI001FF45B18|nr:hypothetical protein [Marivita sp. S6314]MCK0149315.1 hypothetical protein [Marivita sp. S6314]